MAIVPTKQGRLEDLKLMLSKNHVLRLIVNDVSPDYELMVDDFVEVDKNKYIPVTLKASEWSFAFSPRDNQPVQRV